MQPGSLTTSFGQFASERISPCGPEYFLLEPETQTTWIPDATFESVNIPQKVINTHHELVLGFQGPISQDL